VGSSWTRRDVLKALGLAGSAAAAAPLLGACGVGGGGGQAAQNGANEVTGGFDWKKASGKNIKILHTPHPDQQSFQPLLQEFTALTGIQVQADLVAEALEGTAYGLRHNIEELRKRGASPPVLRVVGGGANGNTWNKIKADVTGLPVEVPRETAGAPVGAALLAAAGAGLVDDLADAVRLRRHPGARFQPDAGRHARYQGYYEFYTRLYPVLRDADVFTQLGELRHAADTEER
jgi:FGGY family of carbohydrate kinases, C-terminal domain